MHFKKLAGLGGILFATLVGVANFMLAGRGKPLGDPELGRIVAYYTEHAGVASGMTLVAPFAWFCIALFAAGVVVSTSLPDGRPSGWGIFGLSGVVMMISIFPGVVTADILLTVRASTLAANPEYTRVLWDYHNILQIFNLTCLAIALAGFGSAVIAAATAPRLGKVGLAGAVLLLLSATQSLPMLEGSVSVLAALPGFAIWLAFVLIYSLKMVRSTDVAVGVEREAI